MSGDLLLSQWTRPARRRAAAGIALLWTPLVLVVAAAAWRLGAPSTALAALALGGAAVALACFRAARAHDEVWLTHSLDARRSDMEDSAALLFADPAALGPFQRLQKARLEARLANGTPEALQPAWPGRRIAVAWCIALIAIVAILLWPARITHDPSTPAAAARQAAAAGPPRLIGQQVRIVPPAYTRLPPRHASSLDIRAPHGSRIEWALRFDPAPASAHLEFLGGGRLDLRGRTSELRTARLLDKSMLYRLHMAGAAPSPLHRLEAIPDAPPQVRVVSPEQGLVLVTPGQRSWTVIFEATDDYAVAPTGRMSVTLAQGDGENVTFHERSFAISGTGDPKQRRFTAQLNLAALGLQRGGDLVAQIMVSDTRSPGPQAVRSAGVILRWPPEPPKESGLELMSKKVLPAYFRSQRQIIIDAEALIPQRRRLPRDAYVDRSDAIGVDQRLLRLRYGQFLGEEASGGPARPALPTADAANETPAAHDEDGHAHDGEDPAASAPGFGAPEDVLADYGHTHDESEAATLLDPDTRALLKQALDEMWQSERHLRSGDPDKALPYAYKALAFIKQVQQATRIYLARVGPQLPPIDEGRRMTGKREGLASRAAALTPFEPVDAAPAAAWRALGSAGGRVPLDALDRWIAGNEGRIPDPLGLRAAVEDVRADPGCGRCRSALRARLWTVLYRPPAQVRRRGDGGDTGRRYLEAIR